MSKKTLTRQPAGSAAPHLLLALALPGLALAAAAAQSRAPGPVHAQPAHHSAAMPVAPKDEVSFDRDVRPIIAENCFACHGFDATKRQAGLRLDTPTGAFEKLPDGHIAVVPGDLTGSALVRRINAANGTKMPPPSSGKRLKPEEIALLTRWVAQGAKYQEHWAFVPPKRWPLPEVAPKDAAWCRNGIDRFIVARLESQGLRPSPEADRRTLIRRVTLDLTGLPPTPAEVDAFLNDHQPRAYERVVDRLLASPHYGERMALHWLDLARYADTNGYHIDNERYMWRWRDWVIDAYNHDMPYDQFAVEQIAGDMLPSATLQDRIASGFNRNHPIDFEGGAIPEEYAAAYIFDRINTTATVFMGLTLKCAQCHDHKYDPLTNRDFYRFYALFNNVPEKGLDGQTGNSVPYIKAATPDQAALLAEYRRRVKEADDRLKAREAELAPQEAAWEKTALALLNAAPPAANGLVAEYPLDETAGNEVHDRACKLPAGTIAGKATWAAGKVGAALSFDGSTHVQLGQVFGPDRTDRFSYGAWVYPTSNDAMSVVSRMDDANSFRGWDIFVSGGTVFVHLVHHWDDNAIRVNTKSPIPLNKWAHLFVTYDGASKAAGVKLYVNGVPAELDVTHDKLTDTIATDKSVRIGRRTDSAPFKGLIDEVRFYNRALSPEEVKQLVAYDSLREDLLVAPNKRNADQKSEVSRYFLGETDPTWRKLDGDSAEWRKKEKELDDAIPTTMVMEEMSKPRTTHVLVRGQYDKLGEVVTPGIPAACESWEPGREVNNRLDLARWLVDARNPLTARVAVNRFWMLFLGDGLVRTPENFGTQGEWPTHPKLLDWLAREFMQPKTADERSMTDGGRRLTDGRSAISVAGATQHAIPNAVLEPDDPTPARPWDVKRLVRLIVTSATYRQSSRITPDLEERDPENRLLARGPRFRLLGEFIRDQALAVSGLLVPKIGGPSVKPYQPAGLWEEMSFKGGFSAQFYVQDHGDNLYRRSMYTFWKRTVPPPDLQTFDAPEREFCVVKRTPTDTPLQALIVMNDPAFVEASRKLAERIMKEGGATPAERLRYAFDLVLNRVPRQAESRILLDLLARQQAVFAADPAAAQKLLAVGESSRDKTLDTARLAAWTEIANTILNMDEALTRG